jgi:ribosomal protein S3
MNKNKKKQAKVYRSFMTACDGVGEWLEPVSNCSTTQMGVTQLYYDIKNNKLHVFLQRPGLLIGKAGSNIDIIEKYINCQIKIHEIVDLGVYDEPNLIERLINRFRNNNKN